MKILDNIKIFFEMIFVRILRLFVKVKKISSFKLKLDSTFWFLLSVNLITMIFALVEGLDFPTLLFIYWGQSLIIGVSSFIKALYLKDLSMHGHKANISSVNPSIRTRNSVALLFLFHYGVFHLGYLVFLASRFDSSAFTFVLILSICLFFANHLFSLVNNFNKDIRRKQTLGRVMFFPYLRILPMHLVILAGLYLFDGKGIFFFILFKILLDVLMHDIEHKEKKVEKKPLVTRLPSKKITIPRNIPVINNNIKLKSGNQQLTSGDSISR